MENQEYVPAQEYKGGRRLPVYKGYTVDYRLKEFRRIDDGGLLACYPFKEDFGDKLLAEMIERGLVPDGTHSQLV